MALAYNMRLNHQSFKGFCSSFVVYFNKGKCESLLRH